MRLTKKTNYGYEHEDVVIDTENEKIIKTKVHTPVGTKLGQLEDLMEKYGFETVEDLDNFIQSCINRIKYESKKEKV